MNSYFGGNTADDGKDYIDAVIENNNSLTELDALITETEDLANQIASQAAIDKIQEEIDDLKQATQDKIDEVLALYDELESKLQALKASA
ncbi:hypothetical protein ALNOE001_07770 [Candidatus Methanobinarius endosymbioticus]|uniref:Uncharacterized protein n=1 Tax=Candidatus Methanobinarius endosymbioticus TaxID=2006182 RepID=A0A366MBV0_9EURY|nr:hypothetical protein ALNOE001_07770 [Candidatus Methanobinarius endosymbioticus]